MSKLLNPLDLNGKQKVKIISELTDALRLYSTKCRKKKKEKKMQIEQNKIEIKHKNPVITHTGKISDLMKLDSN